MGWDTISRASLNFSEARSRTFVEALLDVMLPSSGELQVLGGAPGDVAVHARIGYVPERLALPASWTATSYLRSVARLKQKAELRPLEPIERIAIAGCGSDAPVLLAECARPPRANAPPP